MSDTLGLMDVELSDKFDKDDGRIFISGTQAMEITVKRVRLPLVHKFVRANNIDKLRIGGSGGLGIVTSGKSYSDVIHALNLLGLDTEAAKELGIAIYKVGCVWPLEPEGLKEFASGRRELLFIEEKSAVMEPQAAQLGLLPISVAALEKAIELNGTAIKFNLTAFALGRLFAHSPETIIALLPESAAPAGEQTLHELINVRANHLRDYQSQAWADRFLGLVVKTRVAEEAVNAGSTNLTRAVATNLSKLMSYKDEYEVARLYTDPAFKKKLDAQFEPGYTLKFNLAPPMISRTNPPTGKPMKREFGEGMLLGFQVLARLKRLRGTPLDIFGYTAERTMERGLITEYEAMVEQVLTGLSADKLDTAIALARLPEEIRGFAYVKDDSLVEVNARKTELLAAYAA